MDKVFTNHIGRNVKVYVNDIVIKSRHEAVLLCDIMETLQTLEGQFLGYQITKEAVAPNQAMIQEFLNSKTPHNLKGVHEINGRLAAFVIFIAKSGKKNLSLFHVRSKGLCWQNPVQIDNEGR